MSTRLPTSTLSQLLQTVILVCLLSLLGIVIARGLARLTAHVTRKESEITRRRKETLMSNTPAHRFPPFQPVILASLGLFLGSGLLIWIRPMSPKELALSLLIGFGAFIVFGVAAIAQFINPTLAEIRLRLQRVELHCQANTMEADIFQLRTTMRWLIADPSRRAAGPCPAPTAIEDPYVLPDPDDPKEALPVGVDTRSLSM